MCELYNDANMPVILAVSETWLSDVVSDTQVSIGGYSLFRKDRNRNGGGIALYVSEKLFSTNMVQLNTSCEILCVDCYLKHTIRAKPHCVRCVVYYRPTNYDAGEMINFCEVLKSLVCKDKHMLIMGDFNLPNIDWKCYRLKRSDVIQNLLLNTVLELDLYQFVSNPTRLQSVLDLILSNRNKTVTNVCVSELISDHNIIMGDLIVPVKIAENKSKIVKQFGKGDYVAFNGYLCNINWCTVFDRCHDVQSRWDRFANIMNTGIELFVPSVNVSSSERQNHYPAYIRRLVLKKRKKWKSYNDNRNLNVLNEYKFLRKRFKRELRKWRFTFEQRILQSNSTKKFWKYVNNKMQKPRHPILILNNENDTMLNDIEAAEALNKYFASIYVQDDGCLPEFAKRAADVNFTDDVDLSVVAIESVLSGVGDTHSSGPDGFSAFLLKRLRNSISLPLSLIFNLSYESGIVPTIWKNAIVCPVYKGVGSRTCTENYRPISLTSVCCKIMESLVSKALLSHMKANNFLTVAQHGFLSKSSTLTAQLSCYNVWNRALDNWEWIDVISLDYSKAFDTVSHNKLLYKFQQYEFSEKMCTWMKSFLQNRKQCVKVGDVLSTWSDVVSGVPQGSVCGPNLYNLYVNDMPSVIKYSAVVMYADDARMYISSSVENAHEKLGADLASVSDWASAWQLKLNIKKCSVMHMGSKNPNLNYNINNVEIAVVTKMNDLGITIENNLNFKVYMDAIIGKAYRMSYNILNAFYNKSPVFMMAMFKTYVRPLLEYNCVIWSPTTLIYIDKCERVQKYFTKRLHGMWDVPYVSRLEALNVVSLEERRLHMDMICVYKILNGLLNLRAMDFFTLSDYVTRGHPFKIFKPRYNHYFCTNFFQLSCNNHVELFARKSCLCTEY